MTEAKEFTSGKRRDEPITFKLDGKEYGFRPPKRAVMLMPAYTGGSDITYITAQFNWLEKGLNAYDWSVLSQEDKRTAHGIEDPATMIPPAAPEGWRGGQAIELERRLRDDADDLDSDQLDEMVQWLAEQVAGRPTT